MTKKFIFSFLSLLAVCKGVIAREVKPLDAFIERVKTTTKLVPVNNIWSADPTYDKAEMHRFVSKGDALTIDYSKVAALLEKKPTAVQLSFPGPDGSTVTLDMARYDYLSNDFEIHAKGMNNADSRVDYTPGLYYSGVVSGVEGSFVAFSFFKNEVYGIYSLPGQGNFVLVPNTLVGKEYDYNTHYLLYNDADMTIKDKAPKCGTDKLPELTANAAVQRTTTTLNNNIYNFCSYVRCYEVSDNAMYIKKGNSTTNVTNYLTALFNVKATLYRNEGIPIVLKYLQINTAADEYASLPTNNSSRWLTKFGWVTQTAMHGCDVATLYTTKGGTMGGIAWLALTCGGYYSTDSAGPYCFCNVNNVASTAVTAFPTYSWDVEVCTHEMGHNVGSPHTHRCCWNPPARNTAIDGCAAIEGSCSNPGTPSAGTIMSYCHLTTTISFSNGFGPQPGDTIRYYLRTHFSGTCGASAIPTVAAAVANRTFTANRQCTQISSGDTVTYFWADRSTTDPADDTLVLAMRQHGNSIGTLNSTSPSLVISHTTLAGYGGGTGQTLTLPTSITGLRTNKRAFRRYWNITGATTATGNVDVLFPYYNTDISDVDGSIPGTTAVQDFRMYKVTPATGTVDPSPASAFTGLTASNFTIYNYATTTSATQWSVFAPGGMNFAVLRMKNVNGGGTGFYDYTYAAVNVNDAHGNTAMTIYPNPTEDQWQISVDNNMNNLVFRLYAADGREVVMQHLGSGINTVDATNLAAGVYFYRIVGDDNVFTGNLVRR